MNHRVLQVARVAGLLAALALSPSCAVWAAQGTAAPPMAEGVRPLVMASYGAGHWVHVGRVALASSDNAGDIANVGFVVGTRCVAVIDTGNSLRVGQGLLAAIRARTQLPVCWVINTHGHPDHMFGNRVFFDAPGAAPGDSPKLVTHQNYPDWVAARGEGFLAGLGRDLGPSEARANGLVAVNTRVRDTLELDLGGRVLELRAWPTAHTDNDLTVLDRAAGTLWLGDLGFIEHLPVVDGKLTGWLAQLDELEQMKVTRVVPGHGALPGEVSVARALAPQRAYLEALRNRIREQIAQGTSLSEALTANDDLARVQGEAGGGWALTEAFHRRNVSAAFAELEWE